MILQEELRPNKFFLTLTLQDSFQLNQSKREKRKSKKDQIKELRKHQVKKENDL